jgi:hypothetical protein
MSSHRALLTHPMVTDLNIHAHPENISNDRVQSVLNISATIAALIGLYFTTFINYLVFHTLAELFSIVVAFSIFVIAWNSKKYVHNPYLLFVGVAYLFIAFLDLLHTLTFKGMPLFIDYDFYANQLWIGARYMESLTLLTAFFYLRRDKIPRANLVFVVYAVITALLVASIFYWKNFPECFVEGSGLTPFKIISEYIICAILIASLFLLQLNRKKFERKIFWLILGSIFFTILSELAFTLYISNYGFLNLVGHYFKIFSFLLIYKAIIKTGIDKPLELFFFDLKRVNKGLRNEIEVRRKTEEEKEKLIENLKQALEEIKTLQGLLPICSICKSIRDDTGYWNSIEYYFSKHAEVEFSHGICPDCAKKHYAEYFSPEE